MDEQLSEAGELTEDQSGELEQAAKPKPNGADRKPSGYPPTPMVRPSLQLATEAQTGVLIAPPFEGDRDSVGLKLTAEAIDDARSAWQSICRTHVDQMARVNAVTTATACELKSRALANARSMAAYRLCDSALAELRSEIKEVEREVTTRALPRRARDDLAGAIADQETRSWLRTISPSERRKAVIDAMAADDVGTVGAALARPTLAGFAAGEAADLAERWSRQIAGPELEKLATLQKASERVMAAGSALQRRLAESYDHNALDAVARATKAA